MLKGVKIWSDKFNPRVIHSKVVNLENHGKSHLEQLYNLIDTTIVQFVQVTEDIDVWVDEEGLFKSGNVGIRYIIDNDIENSLELVGTSIFVARDEETNLIGLSDEQANWIQEHIRTEVFGIVE